MTEAHQFALSPKAINYLLETIERVSRIQRDFYREDPATDERAKALEELKLAALESIVMVVNS